MRYLTGMGFGLVAGLLPALAQQEPAVWRDPVHGCAYLLPPQGGIGPRYRPDGLPDCVDAPADPAVTGAVAPAGAAGPQAAPSRHEGAECLLFSPTCVIAGAALAPSRRLAVSGTSLRSPDP